MANADSEQVSDEDDISVDFTEKNNRRSKEKADSAARARREQARMRSLPRARQKPPDFGFTELEKLRWRFAKKKKLRRVMRETSDISGSDSSSAGSDPDKDDLLNFDIDLTSDLLNKYGETTLIELMQKIRRAKRKKEFDQLSEQSLVSDDEEDARGLYRLFTHTVKPLATVLDRERRDDTEAIDRATRHLGKITGPALDKALRGEEVFKEADSQVNELFAMIGNLTQELDSFKSESRIKNLPQISKTGQLFPNPSSSYPKEDANNENWIRAVVAFSNAVRVTERSLAFKIAPYDYLLNLLGSSNSIAANFGLSKEQQLILILNHIPSTSAVSKELKMMGSLDRVFALVCLNCSTLLTKAELETKIDCWSLDTSSHQALSESLSILKALYADSGEFDLGGGDQSFLYTEMLRRIKREALSPSVNRQLEEARIFLEQERDPLILHQVLLSSLVGILNKPKKLAVRQLESDQENLSPLDSDSDSVSDSEPEIEGKSYKYKGRVTFVEPWPAGKNYLDTSGNQLSNEIETHFKGFCFRCGMNNHFASNCRIYKEKETILNLCTVCFSGFHLLCRNFKFVNQDGTPKNLFNNQKNQRMGYFMNAEVNPYLYARPGYAPAPFYYPFPLPPQIKYDGISDSGGE